MIPYYLKAKFKLKGPVHALARLLQDMRAHTYEVPPGKIPLAQLLFLVQVDQVFNKMLEKVFKNYSDKEQVSITLSLAELMSIWQLASKVNSTDPDVLDLIAKIDQEAVNNSHFVELKKLSH